MGDSEELYELIIWIISTAVKALGMEITLERGE
jgi:hypothetical protein